MHQWSMAGGQYSQGSQDRYLDRIFSIIKPTNKFFVEFGFDEKGYRAGGTGENTRKLYEDGWRGLLLDADHENPEINLKKHYLFANNIVSIFEENNVPRELDYLSCDMDSHDLWVFRSILQAGYRPRVITTEYNSNYYLNDTITLLDPSIVGNATYFANYQFKPVGCAWGVGAGGLRMLAESHGYTMIGIVVGLDLIWLRNDLLAMYPSDIPPFEWFFTRAKIGEIHHTEQKSPHILSLLVDYQTYVKTAGNLTASNQEARAILKQRRLECYKDVYQYL